MTTKRLDITNKDEMIVIAWNMYFSCDDDDWLIANISDLKITAQFVRDYFMEPCHYKYEREELFSRGVPSYEIDHGITRLNSAVRTILKNWQKGIDPQETYMAANENKYKCKKGQKRK